MSSTGAELFDFIPSSSMSSNCVSGIKMSIARSLSVFPTFRWTAWWTAVTMFITLTVNVVLKVNIAVQNSNGHFIFDCGVTNGSCQMSLNLGSSSYVSAVVAWPKNFPENWDSKVPSVGTLGLFRDYGLNNFFRNKTFLNFSTETFSICLKKNFVKLHKVSTQSDNR